MSTRHRMSNADAAWLHMDRPTNLMVVNALMWCDEPLALEDVRAVVAERLVARFPRFRSRVAEPAVPGLGTPAWEEIEHFDLDLHLHLRALPAPGGPAELRRLVADVMTTPLDRAKPLWHMYLIQDYGAGSALFVRMHHAIADGIALARVLLSLTDEAPGGAAFTDEAPAVHHGALDALTAPVRAGARLTGAAAREGLDIVAHPESGLGRLASDARVAAKLLLSGPDAPSPFKGRLGVARQVTWCEPFELAAVKDAAHATGTTVNDVLLSAVAGALGRHARERGEPAEHVRAMIPFNLRALDEPLPRELGNRFGLVTVELPLAIDDPGRRLREIHRRMEAIKDSPEGVASYGILGALGLTPPAVEQRIIDFFCSTATAVVTNVPGPAEPVWFAGRRVRGVIAWVPAGGDIGLGVSIFSYAGEVLIGLQVDAGLVPDPDAILALFEEELQVLVGRPRRGRGRPRARTAARSG